MSVPPALAVGALYDSVLQSALRQFFERATLDTEPTVEDVRRACEWLRADEPQLRNPEFSSGRKAEEVFEILDDELPDFDSSGRPG